MTIAQSLLFAIVFFFIQPTFIAGVLIAWFARNRRVSYSRGQLRTAIYKDNYELKRFFLWGLLPGAVISIVSVLAGLPLTLDWVILYQLVTILFLGLGYRFIHPIFTFSFTGIILLILTYFDITITENITFLEQWFSPLEEGAAVGLQLSRIILIFSLLLLLSTILTLLNGDLDKFTPRFLKTKRGKLVARYRITPFWMIPVLLVIPGEGFGALFEWWPVFSIGNQTFSFFLLPVLIGFRYTVQAQLPNQAKERLLKEFVWLSGIGILAFVATLWQIEIAAVALVLLFIGGFIVLYRHRKREQRWAFEFGPAEQGLRIVAVKPNSPAEKMELNIGDVLLDCNETELHDAEEFYEAVSINKAYCKLRVQRKDGEIVLKESAIYDDDPHDLGVVFLEDIEIK